MLNEPKQTHSDYREMKREHQGDRQQQRDAKQPQKNK